MPVVRACAHHMKSGAFMGHFRLFVGQKWGSFPSVKVLSPDSEPVTATGSDNRPTRYYITGNRFVKRGCGNSLKKRIRAYIDAPAKSVFEGNFEWGIWNLFILKYTKYILTVEKPERCAILR